MSIREVPSEMTAAMVTGFLQGYYRGYPLKLGSIDSDAVNRADVRRGYAHMLAATPEQNRPELDNIPGNKLMRNARKLGILLSTSYIPIFTSSSHYRPGDNFRDLWHE